MSNEPQCPGCRDYLARTLRGRVLPVCVAAEGTWDKGTLEGTIAVYYCANCGYAFGPSIMPMPMKQDGGPPHVEPARRWPLSDEYLRENFPELE